MMYSADVRRGVSIVTRRKTAASCEEVLVPRRRKESPASAPCNSTSFDFSLQDRRGYGFSAFFFGMRSRADVHSTTRNAPMSRVQSGSPKVGAVSKLLPRTDTDI